MNNLPPTTSERRKTAALPELLVLSPTYAPFKDGLAQAATLMATGLAARGYRVTVATGFHPDRSPSQPADNPQVRQFNVQGTSNLRVKIRGDAEAYRMFIREFRGDCVICHSWETWSTDLAMKEFARLPAAKVLVSHGFCTHRIYWHDRPPWGLGQWLGWLPYSSRLPFFLRKFDRIVFLSRQIDLNRFFDHWVARVTGYRRAPVIPNAVDLTAWRAVADGFRQRHGLSNDLMLLCVANYETRKNQELALRAFREADLNGTLVFIGSRFNDYSARLQQLDQQLAARHPRGQVLFLEKQDRPTTLAAFKECDLFVLPAKEETQPIVLLEAMACGKPFLSTNTGCVEELPGGWVANSTVEFADKLQRLAADSAARAQLGADGRAEIERRYTLDRVLDAYEELLRSLPLSRQNSPR